jgi:DNA polymerase I-like protein with 3'-5' exonuclease and polymerase domains
VKKLDLTTVDFETEAIDNRPRYPPKPVGISIKERGKKPRYWAFGHPTKNNCTEAEAKRALKAVYATGEPLLYQNGAFDVEVADEHWDLRPKSYDLVNDLMYLLFFRNPHSRSFSLKPSAEKYLGMPPEEQDAVRQWLIDNGVVKKNQKDWGAYICKAPGDIVGTYSNGDTIRTEKLWDHLVPWCNEHDVWDAYRREQQLMPILLRNSKEGLRINVRRLARDIKLYEAAQQKAMAWLQKRLKTPNLNPDSGNELADALEKCEVVTEFAATPTGLRSVAKDTMTIDRFHDKKVFYVLGYYTRIGTCLDTFLRKWLAQALETGGTIHTQWNQVRADRGDDKTGARTGRLSSRPNFQNIPKDWFDKGDGFDEKAMEWIAKALGVPWLPNMRVYIMADSDGEMVLHRDYNQQELRILSHYEDGDMLRAYNENPRLDVHTHVQSEVKRVTGRFYERRPIKIVNFLDVYGGGVQALMEKIRCTAQEAKDLKAAKNKAFPGIRELDEEIKAKARAGEYITTWGGRPLYPEEPSVIQTKWGQKLQTWEYKLLNYLIQGSAGDVCKEVIIRYDQARKNGRLLVTVHDENNVSVPKKALASENKILKDVMESVKFDLPMLTDGKVGTNWGEMKKLKE